MLDNRLSARINYLVVASYVGVYFRKEVRIWVEHKFTAWAGNSPCRHSCNILLCFNRCEGICLRL